MFAERSSTLTTVPLQKLEVLVNNLAAVFCNYRPQQPLTCPYPDPQVLLNYLLTPWSKVLEKLTGSQLIMIFPAFHRTRRFITAFTKARHLSLS